MGSGVVLISIAIAWLVFRKAIARRQAQIVGSMLRKDRPPSEAELAAFEKLGAGFSILIFVVGMTLLVGGVWGNS